MSEKNSKLDSVFNIVHQNYIPYKNNYLCCFLPTVSGFFSFSVGRGVIRFYSKDFNAVGFLRFSNFMSASTAVFGIALSLYLPLRYKYSSALPLPTSQVHV